MTISKIKFFQMISFPIFIFLVIIGGFIHGTKNIFAAFKHIRIWNELLHEVIVSTSSRYKIFRLKEMLMITGLKCKYDD